jgi:8-oxo-dGTP pyrophosphatase MutT (NUDIX family)
MQEADAAVSILLAGEPEESILLIRRAERESDPWSGHWSFPGGRREPEDADLLVTALRELEEECGIRLSREDMETALAPMLARRKVGRYLAVAPFVFRIPRQLPVVLDEREAVEALWLPLSVLRDPANHRLSGIPGLPPELAYPGVELNVLPLWGFTYRLITEWLGLGPKDSVEQAGFEAASLVLDFLLTQGLELEHGWEERASDDRVVKVAAVRGEIPVNAVLERFAVPERDIPPVNALEVRPERIRVIGLAFEEYLISASG